MSELIKNGALQSINSPETDFGFTYWSYMIPYFKPKTMLVLGSGWRTIEKLTKKIWGSDIEIFNVDNEDYGQLAVMDAFKAIDICEITFDFVVVDLFNGPEVPEQLWNKEVWAKLRKMTTRALAINIWSKDMEKLLLSSNDYFNEELVKVLNENRIVFLKPYGIK